MEQARAVFDWDRQAMGDAKESDDDAASTISTISSASCEDEESGIDHGIALNIEGLKNLAATIEDNLMSSERTTKGVDNSTMAAFSVSKPALGYVSHVRDKYPRAPARLVERLGEANWQRHVVVRGRMNREAAPPCEKNAPENESTMFSDFRPVSMFHDSGIGTTVSTGSQYAASAASHTSFISSIAENQGASIRVPPTPDEVDAKKPFPCTICGLIQTKIKNRIDWKYV